MSDLALPLGGARATGATSVEEVSPPGMLSVRGGPDVGSALADLMGMAMPNMRGLSHDGDRRIGWMSPDEWLVMVPRTELPAIKTALEERLDGQHALVTDVSDMRAMFRIDGAAPRDVLAKLTPTDLHPDQFGPGELRRTRLAQVAAAFWCEGESFHVVCFRSVGRYVFDLLAEAASDEAIVDYY